MAKTKISEFSSTPANNTDIDSINIAEGCAPSGINDAIRELMAQLKDFQTGAQGDSFNGPIGTSTAAAGAFTTLSATGAITSTLATGTAPLVIASTTKVANLNVDLLDGADWAAPAALGSTTPAAVSATTLTTSSTVTLSGGTANGVAYLNGSKVVTSGSALTFDGTNLGLGTATPQSYGAGYVTATIDASIAPSLELRVSGTRYGRIYASTASLNIDTWSGTGPIIFGINTAEQMRLTSTGLGIGTSSPAQKLTVAGTQRIQKDGAGYEAAMLSFSTLSETGAIYRIGMASGGSLAIGRSDSNTTNLTLDSSGNLGIGTSSPTEALTITGDATYKLSLKRTADSSYAALGATGNAFLFYNNGAERMRIDSSGNLGLGVTTSAWVTLKGFEIGGLGNSISGYPADAGIYVSSNAYYGTGGWKYAYSSKASTLYTGEGGLHSWKIAPSGTAGNAITFTQAMTLDASGNWLLGTTNIGYTRRMGVTGSGDVAMIQTTGSSTALPLEVWNTATSGDNRFIFFYTEGTPTTRGSITYNRAGGLTVYGTTSDYRAKDIIGPVTNSGELIDSVPVYMGKMKGATQERPMFIAHKTPEYAHTGEKDAVDENGNPVYQQMDASALIPVMWAEIQSLRKRLADAGL